MKDRLSLSLKWVYLAALCVGIFTGFGNMPLWRRYYIADIPGFYWTRNFIINVNVHYVAGSILLFISLYFLTTYLLMKKNGLALTGCGKTCAALMGMALLTGLIMALKCFPGINYPMKLLIFFNLAHLGSTCLFMFSALSCAATRKKWVKQINQG